VVDGAGDPDALALAAGEADAAFADDCLDAVRHTPDHVVELGGVDGAAEGFVVDFVIGKTERDVVLDCVVQQVNKLRDVADIFLPAAEVGVDVCTVNRDFSGGRFEEAEDEIDHRGLAGTGRPDKCNRGAAPVLRQTGQASAWLP